MRIRNIGKWFSLALLLALAAALASAQQVDDKLLLNAGKTNEG
jgi:hypothetical protein